MYSPNATLNADNYFVASKNCPDESCPTNHEPHVEHRSGHDKFASPVRLRCPVLKSRLQKTIGLKILRRGPVARFRLPSFSCNRALLFHTWHCLSPQIFSRQRAQARSFCSYYAVLTAINAKYKPKEATFDILKVKRSALAFVDFCILGAYFRFLSNSVVDV